MSVSNVAPWKLTLLVLLVTFCLLGYDAVVAQKSRRNLPVGFKIVGGRATSIARVPYLINLRRNKRFVCGGTLVRSNFVITAAHCVKGAKPRNLRVVAGATLLTQNGYQSLVSKYFLPRNFKESTINDDIAVLKLERSISGPDVQPIPLCHVGMRAGMRARVSGWGKQSDKSNRLSTRVRTVEVPIISRRLCQREFGRRVRLTRTMMCAGAPGKDSCTGDSGGPFVVDNSLCGVVSFGIGCAHRGSPGVYTNINAVRSFINRCLKM